MRADMPPQHRQTPDTQGVGVLCSAWRAHLGLSCWWPWIPPPLSPASHSGSSQRLQGTLRVAPWLWPTPQATVGLGCSYLLRGWWWGPLGLPGLPACTPRGGWRRMLCPRGLASWPRHKPGHTGPRGPGLSFTVTLPFILGACILDDAVFIYIRKMRNHVWLLHCVREAGLRGVTENPIIRWSGGSGPSEPVLPTRASAQGP